ncbi:MAG: tetratricopeptide repeat protein, partial [Bacteroidia bacterium]|nr:tetratricopeptide repeat protein [Bacteroidia bacterium]
YVTDNPVVQHLNAANIATMFSGYSMGNYHPLTLLSLSVNYFLWGNHPLMFHITSVLLHLICTILVFYLVSLLFRNNKTAFFASLLFGVCTLHVESVAWISERKDLLYSVFFLSSLILYFRYTESMRWRYYLISLVFFIFSLFSKGQAVSLSVTLILMDYITNRRLADTKVILEKIPFFILSLVFGIIAIKAQKAGNSIVEASVFGIPQRIAFAGYGYVMYIVKMIIPFGLSAIYPYPNVSKSISMYFYLFPLLTGALLSLIFIYFRKVKWLIFGWLFYSVNVFLVLQLLPVGSAIMADRYSYIPSLGFFIIPAYLLTSLSERNQKHRKIVPAVFIIYAVIIAVLTMMRIGVWRDSETLWTDVIQKHPEVMTAWDNRGNYRNDEKDFKGAISDYTQAILLKPDYADAWYNRAVANNSAGNTRAALADFNQVEKLKPLFPDNYYNRGLVNHTLGNRAEALADYSRAIELQPSFWKAYSNRGNVKRDMNDIPGAIADYSKAIELNPAYDDALSNRGAAFGMTGKYAEAIRDFDNAIKVNPKYDTAWFLRGMAKMKLGNKNEACNDLETAVRLGNTNAARLMKMYCK